MCFISSFTLLSLSQIIPQFSYIHFSIQYFILFLNRPDTSLSIGTLTSAITGCGASTVTGMSTLGRSKSRMTGEQRKKHAQKQRKKLMREMDSNIERERSLSRAGSRSGSRMGSRMDLTEINDIDLNAKQAGAEFSMDLLSKKLSGTVKVVSNS